MVGSARHLFARGHTARGPHSLYGSAFLGLRRIFVLDGPAGCGKSTLLQRMADEWIAQGESVELFHSPLNPADLDGLILKGHQVGIADGRTWTAVESETDAQIVRIDLGQAVDTERLSEEDRQEIDALQSDLRQAYAHAFESFAAALRIHDEWEAIYIGHMAFAKADQVTQELISTLLGAASGKKRAAVRHLFFGAATPDGAVDHLQSLTGNLANRIFIKGRPGSGKSTLLKALAKAAEAKGIDVEVFHCGFDPNSLDMLVFPELGVAIFDSTAPHEYFPSRAADDVLDMYERTMQPGTDERYADDLRSIQQRYAQKMQEATAHLKNARQLHARLKGYYSSVTDFDRVERLTRGLQQEIRQVELT